MRFVWIFIGRFSKYLVYLIIHSARRASNLVAALGGMKTRRPIIARVRAAGILARLTSAAMIAKLRINRALQVIIALANGRLHRFPSVMLAKLRELPVEVERDRRPGKPTRDPRALRRHAHQKKRHPTDRIRKLRARRVAINPFCPRKMLRIMFVKLLEPLP